MKWFMIIYTLGKIGGIAGPLPYDGEECWRRAAEIRAPLVEALKTGKNKEGRALSPDQTEVLKTMRVECELRPNKPKIGDNQ